MNWWLNFLVKIFGGLLTSIGLLMLNQYPIQTVWVIVLMTAGIALLFAPEFGKDY